MVVPPTSLVTTDSEFLMVAANGDTHAVFISYSHDSASHKAAVLQLCTRLRNEGVDCWIDQYISSPGEGWPNWMRFQIRKAKYVLVVCSEIYTRRLDLEEEPGRGFGATWEAGLITYGVYESQGRNSKFIPIVLSAADVQHIPDFLRPATYFDVSTEEGYLKLYALVTGQVLIPVPPLGERRVIGVPAAVDPSAMVAPKPSPAAPTPSNAVVEEHVLLTFKGETYFIRAERIVQSKNTLEMALRPRNAHESAFLAKLDDRWSAPEVGIAYGNSAHLATVQQVVRSRERDVEEWQIVTEARETGALGEMGTSSRSSRDIAELRARRILLDEKAPETKRDSLLEVLVQGASTPLKIEHSPFPVLYREVGSDPRLFLAFARLIAVFYLRLSDTVEHVLELELELQPGALRVHFLGRRRDIYVNRRPEEIAVDGSCPLDG
jgi:hypothetical protein